jgi:hypothetical protein
MLRWERASGGVRIGPQGLSGELVLSTGISVPFGQATTRPG